MKKIIIKNFNFLPKKSRLVYLSDKLSADCVYFELKEFTQNVSFGEEITLTEYIEYDAENPLNSIFDANGNVRNGYIVAFCPCVEYMQYEDADNYQLIKQTFTENGLIYPENLYKRNGQEIKYPVDYLVPLFFVDIKVGELKMFDTIYGCIPFGYSESLNQITKDEVSPDYIMACHYANIPTNMYYIEIGDLTDYRSRTMKARKEKISVSQETITRSSPYKHGSATIYFKSAASPINPKQGTMSLGDVPGNWRVKGELFE